MPMIFPGMDPYLENPVLWPGVHNPLVVYVADQLQPLLRPRYVAAIEERVYTEGPAVVEQVYESGQYRARIDYHASCLPPLEERDQSWANELLAATEAP